MTRASTYEPPKIFAGLPERASSSLSPAARAQGPAKSSGEYHTPPSTNVAAAAVRIAQGFRSTSIAGLLCSVRRQSSDGSRRARRARRRRRIRGR